MFNLTKHVRMSPFDETLDTNLAAYTACDFVFGLAVRDGCPQLQQRRT